ncbi:hypothetical protein DFH11DRAFT_1544481 [Phellopilus nigrolimitatus]|nr:hypothetical protein DFH11DRAFT_1544481 [Phellopilus nigrolimitatus]
MYPERKASIEEFIMIIIIHDTRVDAKFIARRGKRWQQKLYGEQTKGKQRRPERSIGNPENEMPTLHIALPLRAPRAHRPHLRPALPVNVHAQCRCTRAQRDAAGAEAPPRKRARARSRPREKDARNDAPALHALALGLRASRVLLHGFCLRGSERGDPRARASPGRGRWTPERLGALEGSHVSSESPGSDTTVPVVVAEVEALKTDEADVEADAEEAEDAESMETARSLPDDVHFPEGAEKRLSPESANSDGRARRLVLTCPSGGMARVAGRSAQRVCDDGCVCGPEPPVSAPAHLRDVVDVVAVAGRRARGQLRDRWLEAVRGRLELLPLPLADLLELVIGEGGGVKDEAFGLVLARVDELDFGVGGGVAPLLLRLLAKPRMCMELSFLFACRQRQARA